MSIPLRGDQTRHRLSDCPDETGELARHGGARLHRLLAAVRQMPISLAQALLRFPGDLLDRFGRALRPPLQELGFACRMPIGPRRLYQQTPNVAFASLGDGASGLLRTAGMLAWYQTQVGHKLRRTGKAMQVTNLGDDGRGTE